MRHHNIIAIQIESAQHTRRESIADPKFIRQVQWLCCLIVLIKHAIAWWCHQMDIFSALLAIRAVTGEFCAQRPVTRNFDVIFDPRLNKRLNKTMVRLVIWDAIVSNKTSLQRRKYTFVALMLICIYAYMYTISQEICTRFLLCCALLWLYIDWFSHIHQAYFTGTVAI